MARPIVRIEGMKACREAMQELSRGVQRNVGKKALKAPAGVLVRHIKAKAAVSSRASNPTPGSMRDAVRDADARTERGRATRVILVEDVAAVPNEYGTSKMAAQPFARPGVDAGRDEAGQAMADALKVEVDAAAQRAARRGAKGR